MRSRIALLLGNGKYALELHRRLRVNDSLAALSIALFPHGDTAVTTADHCVDLLSPTQVLNLLRNNQITHIVFGGNFDFTHISATWQDKPLHLLKSAADFRLYPVLFSLVRGGASFALNHFFSILRDNDFEPILASDHLNDLKPGLGQIVSAGRLAMGTSEDILAMIAQPAQQAIEVLAGQPWRHVRQALLFDGDKLVLQETGGTDPLLIKAKALPKTAAIRTLIKLCPPNFDYRMDPPVVGPTTFRLAAEAGVDLVVIEGEKGILFDRIEISEICSSAGITLFGFDSDRFRLAQPTDCAPAA